MNLDKFKSIQTKIDIDTDADYSKLIASLPEKKSKKPVLTVIGTVAAALLLVVGVTVWALVGRGVRNGGKAPITPADESQSQNNKEPSKNPTQTTDTEQKTIQDIAKEYYFVAIRDFEEGLLPDYVRYHVSFFIDSSYKVQYQNDNGGMFFGIPVEIYDETLMRLYGRGEDRDDAELSDIAIDFEEQTGYLKYADLVRLKDGSIHVALEIGGNIENGYIIDEFSVEDGIATVKYKITYNDEPTNEVHILRYTTDDGLTPKMFLSKETAISVSLAPYDDSMYISEPEFLAQLPHLAFDVEYDADNYSWAEDGMLSEKMTYDDLYKDLWTFIQKYHFYGIEVDDFVVVDNTSETTLLMRSEAENILKRLDALLIPDNIQLRFQSGNRCTIDGVNVDYFETVAFFEIAKVTRVEYKAKKPENCHKLCLFTNYGPLASGNHVDYTVYFTENQVYWNECLYTINDGYFTEFLKNNGII